MKRIAAATVAAAITFAFAGCAYHNAIYNAERMYDRAEGARRAGDDESARELYGTVTSRLTDAYDARPGADWSDEALLLLAQAHLRLGDSTRAEEAAQAVLLRSGDDELRATASVYRAAARGPVSVSEPALEPALAGLARPHAGAEAHLLRGRALAELGLIEAALWDLDRAAALNGAMRVELGLERLRWGVQHADSALTRAAVSLLLELSPASERLETVAGQLREATTLWGGAVVASFLGGADRARWPHDARGRLALERARFLRLAGDSATAVAEAEAVARSVGGAAVDARILLATWSLERAADIADAYAVRDLLLPVGTDPRVAQIIDGVDALELFTDIGLDEPLGWFAAAEVARDRLGADYLARGLFLAYADGAPGDPWAPKALLAAMDVSPTVGDQAWLRGRLEASGPNPYVLAAFGESAQEVAALEEELQVRLNALAGR